MYPAFSRSRVRAFRVSRVREVFPIATLGYSRTLPPIETSLPGVFAAGDCTVVPYKQIVIAMGEGAKASLSAFDYLIRSPLSVAA